MIAELGKPKGEDTCKWKLVAKEYLLPVAWLDKRS